LTLAPGSIANPARSDVTVTGTDVVNVPANAAQHPHTIDDTIAIKTSVHHAGWIRDCSVVPSTR
jgi:hypothetical protein